MPAGVTCVVPARLGSTRFFGKLLTPLRGKPVVVHALERAADAGCFERIVCVTDSAEIGAAVVAHGFEYTLTGEAANGTERIARALDRLSGDLFVNLQGDEPAFPPEGLRTLHDAIVAHPEWVHTLVQAQEPAFEELANPNRVKTVLDAEGFIAGFTREVSRNRSVGAHGASHEHTAPPEYRLQLGAYAYSRAYLERYAALPPSPAELALSHEMLRAPGLAPLRAHAAPSGHAGASVDAPDDLDAARRALEDLLRPEPQARLQGMMP